MCLASTGVNTPGAIFFKPEMQPFAEPFGSKESQGAESSTIHTILNNALLALQTAGGTKEVED